MRMRIISYKLSIFAALFLLLPIDTFASSKVMSAKIQLELLEVALYKYCIDMKGFPTTDEGLNVLAEPPENGKNWKGPYLERGRIPTDPWDNRYRYIFPPTLGTERFDLYSYGLNGKDDSGKVDDISIWREPEYSYDDHSFDPIVLLLGALIFDFPVALLAFIIWRTIKKKKKAQPVSS